MMQEEVFKQNQLVEAAVTPKDEVLNATSLAFNGSDEISPATFDIYPNLQTVTVKGKNNSVYNYFYIGGWPCLAGTKHTKEYKDTLTTAVGLWIVGKAKLNDQQPVIIATQQGISAFGATKDEAVKSLQVKLAECKATLRPLLPGARINYDEAAKILGLARGEKNAKAFVKDVNGIRGFNESGTALVSKLIIPYNALGADRLNFCIELGKIAQKKEQIKKDALLAAKIARKQAEKEAKRVAAIAAKEARIKAEKEAKIRATANAKAAREAQKKAAEENKKAMIAKAHELESLRMQHVAEDVNEIIKGAKAAYETEIEKAKKDTAAKIKALQNKLTETKKQALQKKNDAIATTQKLRKHNDKGQFAMQYEALAARGAVSTAAARAKSVIKPTHNITVKN